MNQAAAFSIAGLLLMLAASIDHFAGQEIASAQASPSTAESLKVAPARHAETPTTQRQEPS